MEGNRGPHREHQSSPKKVVSRSSILLFWTLIIVDDDLAKALAQSMQGVPQPSEFGPQEVGTTGANTSSVSASFGPALPDKKYDPSSWALTTTKAEEVLLDPEPRDRRRIPGNPALLRSSSYGDNLGAVLTILHSIPLARQALFACWHTPLNQGYGEHWWKTGQNQLTRRIVRADDDEIAGRILEETQRCMAFLDKTDRAYGCADGLADMARNLATVQHNGKSYPHNKLTLNWNKAIRLTF